MKILRFWKKRVVHPFFPASGAYLAASARGRSRVLAGTVQELARAAARGVEASRAVYVLTGESGVLSDGERDELWRLFQVPVYALRKRGDRVVAWECEAQNGLHTVEGGDEVACACGRPGAVVMPPRAIAHAAD